MADTDDSWIQYLTLSDCNRHMLDSGMLSDVTFKVGFPEGEKKIMAAHKFALVSRSPVWKAMFCGDLAANNEDPIPIEDIEPDIFKDLLIFLYTDDVELNKDNALHLQYAAKKYIVPTLEKDCSQFLHDNITTRTVCTILSHAVRFQDKELEGVCLRYLQENTQAVLEGDDFLSLSHDALCLLLELKELDITDEIELFKTCSYWAQESLTKQGITITESMIRETLGRALFLIRFPAADGKKFALEMGQSNVLTPEEKNDIYRFSLTGQGNEDGRIAGFSTRPRSSFPLLYCNRFNELEDRPGIWQCSGLTDSIYVTVDKNIELVGIGVYGTKSSALIESVDLTMYDNNGSVMVSENLIAIKCNGGYIPIPILLSKPIDVDVGVKYEISVTLKCANTHSGTKGTATICVGGCTFTFSRGRNSNNGTSETSGQIPQLIFREA